jgi:glycosyltransferase involved in cell wall biosynthesis
MRIGVNCFSLQPHIGGLKQYFLSLFDELLQHDTDNNYVLFHFKQNETELADLRTRRWKDSAVLLADQTEVAKYCDQIDLYFCPFGFLWPRPLPLPTVVTLTDVQEVFYPEYFTNADLYSRAAHYPGSTLMADHVITISNYSKQTIVEAHNLKSRNITVAHLCADERYYRAPEIARSASVSLPFADFAIYPANRWPHKNHDVLLRALRILRNDQKILLNLVLTGYDPPEGYPLLTKAAEYGVADQVYCARFLSVEEMSWLYQNAQVLVFPSIYEGFGIPLVEAMAAGCPVVASLATCIPEIGREAAQYFDPASPEQVAASIALVLSSESLRRQMIATGKAVAAGFSPNSMAVLHKHAFQEAIKSYSAGRYYFRRIQHQWLALGTERRYRRLLSERANRRDGREDPRR